jgi:predicted nucleic acid-binding protein
VYLADAHALGWYFTGDPRLGRKAARIFERSEKGEFPIVIPSIVLAELFHIGRKQRIDLDFAELLREIEERSNFIVAALDLPTLRKVPEVASLSELHDQIIVATALLYEAKVLTKDGAIRAAGQVETVW